MTLWALCLLFRARAFRVSWRRNLSSLRGEGTGRVRRAIRRDAPSARVDGHAFDDAVSALIDWIAVSAVGPLREDRCLVWSFFFGGV